MPGLYALICIHRSLITFEPFTARNDQLRDVCCVASCS